MSNPAKPVWPDPGALPFSVFGAPAAGSSPASPQSGAQTSAQAFAQPFAQGLAGGVDFMKKLWGNVPGNTAVPSFLLPTLDVDELDKRISDLKAAESWLEVNLTLLRATVQGLQVQRHTIAAIRSLGVPIQTSQAGPEAPPPTGGLPPGWPVANQSEGATRAGAGPAEKEDREDQAASAAPVQGASSAMAPEKPGPHADASQAREPHTSAAKKAARNASRPSSSSAEMPDVSPASGLAGLTANNWLGYMQDQFAKVAQAALASSATVASHESRESAAAPARKSRPKVTSKATAKRKPATKKRASR